MMKKILLILVLSFIFLEVSAQRKSNRVMLSAGLDLYKTDHIGAFRKYQIGFEGNFFVSDNVALTLGYEHHTRNADAIALGYRLYVLPPVFLRMKPLINLDNRRIIDLDLGGGYNYFLNDNFSLEFAGDYYLASRQAALRFGLSVLF